MASAVLAIALGSTPVGWPDSEDNLWDKENKAISSDEAETSKG